MTLCIWLLVLRRDRDARFLSAVTFLSWTLDFSILEKSARPLFPLAILAEPVLSVAQRSRKGKSWSVRREMSPRLELPTKRSLEERRARLTSLAGDILERLRAQPRATRFVFEVPQGRVCLYVVRGERRVQIVAFCPAALRDVVERALAQVRYAL